MTTPYTLSTGKTVLVEDIELTIEGRKEGIFAVIFKDRDTNGEPKFEECDRVDVMYLLDNHQIRHEIR